MASASKAEAPQNGKELPKPVKLFELLPHLKNSMTATPSNGLWAKPKKLNIADLQGELSGKKSTSRRLFMQGKGKKEPPSRKTISGIPGNRPTFAARRTSANFKVPQPSVKNKTTFIKPRISVPYKAPQSAGRNQTTFIKPRISVPYKAPQPTGRNQVYISRFTIGPAGSISSRRNQEATMQKGNTGTGPCSVSNLQKNSAVTKSATKSNRGITVPAYNEKKMERSGRDLEQMTNLETSISLVPLEDVEEKWDKEPSVFKSQLINCVNKNQALSNIKGNDKDSGNNLAKNQINYVVNKMDFLENKVDCLAKDVLTIKESILFLVEKITQMDVKCNQVVNKSDKIMQVCDKNMTSYKTDVTKEETDSENCPIDSSAKSNKQTEGTVRNTNACIDTCADEKTSLNSDKTVTSTEAVCSPYKDSTSLAGNKSELGSPATDKKVLFKSPDNANNVAESESVSYSSRRKSARLQNRKAQTAYESLRKSTKLLVTPLGTSNKNTRTPGRISRKVIAQLNDLYCD